MERKADLHVHTNASDGAFTPAQAVRAAAECGLAAVAITDHDTVDGIEAALAAGREHGVEVVPGVEISATHEEKLEVHILGYFIDHRNADLLSRLATLKNARWERGRQMVEKLNAAGVHVDFERIEELADGGAIGRPHVARAICEVGAASSLDAAFGKFLQAGGPGYVARYKVTPVEAVRAIVEAGGVACCAHVGKLKADDLVVELIRDGLAAVEVYHPDHGPATCRYYKRFAEKHGLIATGGSDAHCFDPRDYGGIGEITVACEIVGQLRRAAGAASPRKPESNNAE